VNPGEGRGASAPSIIRKKGEIQRGEQVPSDGSLALPKDVVMEPLGLEGLLNTNLDIQVFTPTRGPNGFPGGHADFNRGHPSLEQDSFQRVLVVKVPAPPLRPEVVQQKAYKNVEGLPDIGVTPNVVSVEVGGILFLFDDGLA
jgi:hypothetical protein